MEITEAPGASEPEENPGKNPARAAARKIGVGIAGGGLVAVGVPMLVLPGPGTLFIIGGLAVLATEFPGARRRLEEARAAVQRYRARHDPPKDASRTEPDR